MRRPKRHANLRWVRKTARVRKGHYMRHCAVLELYLLNSMFEQIRLENVALELVKECARLKKLLNEAQANMEVKRV